MRVWSICVYIAVFCLGCNSTEEARRQAVENNLKQIGEALKNYHQTHQTHQTFESPFSHIVAAETEYFIAGPHQGGPPDGKFAAGTKVSVVEESGSFVRVKSEEGLVAYVAVGQLENNAADVDEIVERGVERLDTNHPRMLVALKQERQRFGNVTCDGSYKHHLQGICTDKEAIYWSFTTTLVKTDLKGKVWKHIPVANHHGDLCFHDGKLYVAVNLGKFNDPDGNADSWVYVYDTDTLEEVARHETQEVFHGAGGIGIRNGHFYVVGGLPDGVEENYVYEYDNRFKFLKKHVLKSGHTLLGIQTAAFAHDRWWFGCYGDPKILLVTDADFKMLGRYEFDCSLGIEGLPDGRLLSASGRCGKDTGCTGSVRIATPDATVGLKYVSSKEGSKDDE